MRRLTVTEPDADTLELCFDATGREGAAKIDAEAHLQKGGWLLQRRPGSPRASNAERYSLMRRLTVTEPDADTLELCFDATGREGAARLAPRGRQPPKAVKRLQHLSISPCAATELKARCLPSPSPS